MRRPCSKARCEDQENNRRFLEIIKAHAIRLNNIASDLLALSELEAGKARSEPDRIVGSRGGRIGPPHRGVGGAHSRHVILSAGDIEDARVLGDRLQI